MPESRPPQSPKPPSRMNLELRVRLLGGAGALFGSGVTDISPAPATVGELLDRLNESLGSRGELDPSSVLVAVNGADSSVRGGAACPISPSDDVAVIPVVHGGAFSVGRRRALVVCSRGRADLGFEFLDELRRAHPRLRIQAVRSNMVVGGGHVRKILQLALEYERRGAMISEKIETEILLRFAVTTQISRAIREAGIRPGRGFVLTALGRGRDLDRLARDLRGRGVKDSGYMRSAEPHLRRKFGISRGHLQATASPAPLEDVLAELSAVLS